MAGETALVRLDDGTMLNGALRRFVRAERRLLIEPDGAGAQAIPFPRISFLELSTTRRWIPRADGYDADGDPSSAPVDYRIVLRGGHVIEGRSLGYRRDSAGLYLYPVHEDKAYGHVFVPDEAIEAQQFEHCTALALPGPADEAAPDDTQDTGESAGDDPVEPAHDLNTPEALEEVLVRQKPAPKQRLGEILVREGIIGQAQLDEALECQRGHRLEGRSVQIGQVLMELGILDLAAMLQALSERLGIPFVDLDRFRINPEALRFIPEDMVRKYRILPIHQYGSKLVVALENPMDWEALDLARFHSKLHVEQVMASREAIDRAIDTLYAAPEISDSLHEYLVDDADGDETGEQEYDESSVQDNVIVRLVNKIIIDAYRQRASDIHIEPYAGNKTVVRIRKDGVLKHYYDVPGRMRNALIARIKIMADLDISEKRKPQDGKIDFRKYGPLRVELRVATIPTAGDQEDVVMRILAGGEPIPLEKLGLSQRNLDIMRGLAAKPYGLFLVCGPTGSGKTTTLHSVLGHLNTSERKIWTAEDPVEITQRGLRQVAVKPKIGFTFAAAMRAFLRADPDIIMVGEMRDRETTGMGIEASLTGHLVFSTLHTNTAPETVTRLLEMGMDPFNFADALIGILAQRLARRLCPDCKVPYEPDEDEIATLAAEYCYELAPEEGGRKDLQERVLADWRAAFADDEGRFTLYGPKGCPACDESGYRGRLGIHELLTASDAIKKHIHEQSTVAELFATAVSEGMRTLKQDGIEKVLQGMTDARTVRQVCIR